jgi:hypothetical protein
MVNFETTKQRRGIMIKRTKNVIALAAAVTSLGASLGVATTEVQAAEKTTKPKAAVDTVIKTLPQKTATTVKKPAASKTGNQIKWEKPK